MNKKELVNKIINALSEKYNVYKSELIYNEPWQFLISIILSAQTTDKIVNSVTPILFDKYRSLKDLANADIDDVKSIIYKTGFYNNKAKKIIDAAKYICDVYNCNIPKNIDEMVKIPGIGRKTANVYISQIYGQPQGIVVDTHVMRLSTKIWKLSNKSNADLIEKDLMQIIPYKYWILYSFAVVLHGRYICKAIKPNCQICNMTTFCPYFLNKIKK